MCDKDKDQTNEDLQATFGQFDKESETIFNNSDDISEQNSNNR